MKYRLQQDLSLPQISKLLLVVAMLICNPRTRDLEEGQSRGSRVQAHPKLQSESEISLNKLYEKDPLTTTTATIQMGENRELK